jgi:asparagine synthase (glutamine-hydrolysing)
VLVGEGPDEVCSSYLFNWYAPSGEELDKASREYVKNIHFFDSRRGDRCISYWGLEGRVPFLDPEVIEAYWSLPPDWRRPQYKGIEKWWLRKAFEGLNLLPAEVLWRKKEAFSDGVSSKKRSWFEIIQEKAASIVSEEDLKGSAAKYPHNPPTTKEAYYFREIFTEIYGAHRQTILPHYWLPKWDKTGALITGYVDPSARTLDVYNEEKK